MTRRLTHLTILGLLCCLPLLAGFTTTPAAHPTVAPAPSAITLTMVASAADAIAVNPSFDASGLPSSEAQGLPSSEAKGPSSGQALATVPADSSAASLTVPQSAALVTVIDTDTVAQPDLAEPMNGFGGGLLAAAPAEPIQLPTAPPVQGAALARAGAPVVLPIQARKPPTPRAGVTWVQAFKPTVLWNSDNSAAASLSSLPQWTTFRLIGTAAGKRLQVEYPGDGVASLPMRGWVEAVDVGPAGRPNPDWELAKGGDINPLTGIAAPRRVVQAWPQGISAQFAALVDGESGELLWGRNANGQVAPASLTKIVTSLVALDRAQLGDRVDVNVDSRVMWESTVMGLTPGENLSMETLLFGLMLPSGNDAALAIARAVGGSDTAFVDLMNAKTTELELSNSHFANPHGLDADGHYSSPYDLSIFARDGMRNPTFLRLASTRQYTGEGYNLHNLNRLLDLYPKADGVKVGYTDAAGRAIVASATQNGHRVYAVLLRSNGPVPEAQSLLEWAFSGFTWP